MLRKDSADYINFIVDQMTPEELNYTRACVIQTIRKNSVNMGNFATKGKDFWKYLATTNVSTAGKQLASKLGKTTSNFKTRVSPYAAKLGDEIARRTMLGSMAAVETSAVETLRELGIRGVAKVGLKSGLAGLKGGITNSGGVIAGLAGVSKPHKLTPKAILTLGALGAGVGGAAGLGAGSVGGYALGRLTAPKPEPKPEPKPDSIMDRIRNQYQQWTN